MHRFFTKHKRSRVYVDAAFEMMKFGALLYASHKMQDTNYGGPSTFDLVCDTLTPDLPEPIAVFVRVGGLTRVAHVRNDLYPVYEKIVADIGTTNFYMTYNGKPVNVTMSPGDLGMKQGDTVVCTVRCLGGFDAITEHAFANPLFATSSMSVEIEKLVMRSRFDELAWLDLPLPLEEIQTYAGLSHQEIVNKIRVLACEQLQGSDDDEYHLQTVTNWRVITHYAVRGLQALTKQGIFPGYAGSMSDVVEGLLILQHWHSACKSVSDYWVLARTAYMCFTGKSLCSRLMKKLVPDPELQGFDDVVEQMRLAFDTASTVSDCGIVKRLRKMYTFFLVQGVLSKMGFEATEDEFEFLHKKATSSKYRSRTSMWVHIVETTIYICERFACFRRTGSVDAFFREGQECEEWCAEATRLLALAPFTANLEPHGTTYFRFLSDLNDAIEKGQGFAKAFRLMGAERTNPVSKQLGALMLLKNAEVTKRASLKSRHAPFGVLVYGHSGVAKSSFMRVLFHAYGSIFSLDRDDHYLYTRCPANEYWSNFDSSMWAIQMDDIAFLRPSATADVDPTLKELLNVVNNVPYTPPQADLADKGKTPVLAKLVLATTNCEDLNASEYFYCPLAVRRRLPYVIEVTPKREYMQDNGVFIEPTKLPDAAPGYPNFWDIQVKKIVPSIAVDGREMATLEVVARFNDIREFVQHFGAAAKQHVVNQSKGEAVEEFVKQVELCPVCCAYQEDCACNLQWDAATVWESCAYYGMWAYVTALTWWLRFSWFHAMCAYLARFQLLKRIVMVTIVRHLPAEQFVRFMTRANVVVHDVRTRYALAFLTLFSTALALYARVRKQDEELEPQGNVMGTTEDDLEKTNTQNVWYREDFELSSFEVPVASASLAGKSSTELRDMFARNTASIHIKALDGPYRGHTRGFFYRGTTLMFNAHTLKGNKFELTILRGMNTEGVCPRITITVERADIDILTSHDLATINVPSMPPVRDISKYWADEVHSVSKAFGIGRTKSGSVDLRTVWAMSLFNMQLTGLEGLFDTWIGTTDDVTKGGDCGTIYAAETPRGPMFFAMHVAGYENKLAAMYLPKRILDACAERVQPTTSVISGEGVPLLSLQGTPQLLTPHTKSVFRYLEQGTAELYGRLPGFLPKPRSKVTATPLCEEMEKHFGEKCGYTRPQMDGWLPVRNNVKEMVVPTVNYCRGTLTKCKEAFLADILESLPTGWEGSLVELSDMAALNGLPGVRYVDKINTNSSMGFPWNTPKKRYLDPICTDKYPQGVDFPEDVWEKVREVEQCYANKHRAYPVFMGHLKDTPVTFAHYEAAKTRLFAGGPVHWSIVVRKTLLSFVKLVQDNKYTFEAGPGTVCQSIEWQRMREYLTKYGSERIIAGDYSKFDKHMIADFIMAAFWIIAELHKRAGHDDEFYAKIMGIGTDIAYPVMNIRGEIVMFYGTNPSGHPLTVIVNSLVNSLYMRYAYTRLGYDVRGFKSNVALMTYGDDNAMGVSIHVPRFTHTNVQAVLAEIGVTYTMADKESESVPYVHIDTVAFLKRRWRFDADIGAYVCPLEEDSIKKSLMCWVPSNTICPEEQMVAVIQSAIREYFWYGRETFERKRDFFMKFVTRSPYVFFVGETPLPTWQELKDQFWESSC